MCIWDNLQTKARRAKPRAFIGLENREIELPNAFGRVKSYYIEARLGTSYDISPEAIEHCRPELRQFFERKAREQLAWLLYEDIIERVQKLERAILEERSKQECLSKCEELIQFMTNDDARPHTTAECHERTNPVL